MEVMMPFFLLGEGLGLFGATGVGKSTLIAFMVRQLVERGYKVWIFDSENEFPGLLWDLVESGKMLFISYRDFRRNPFEPVEGELPVESIGRSALVFRGALFLGDGSQLLLSDINTRLFTERGVFNGSKDYHCIIDAYERLLLIRVHTQREGEWLVTLKNRIGGLVRQLGDVYGVSRGWPLGSLLEQNVIWGLQGLDQYHHALFIQDLLSAVMAYRDRHRPGEFRNALVIDEIHKLVLAEEGRNYVGESLLVGAARVTRRAGLGIIVADQVPQLLPAPLMANLGTKISFRLADGRDVWAVGTSMSLTKEQMEYLTMLPDRRVVIHAPRLYPRAFLVDLPDLRS